MQGKIKFLAIITGPIFLLCGAYLFIDSLKKVTTYSTAQGRVITMSKTSSARRSGYPNIQFKTSAGQLASFNYYTFMPTFYTKGDYVQVLYNPNDPNDATVNDSVNLWGWSLLAVILGIGGSILGYKFLMLRPNNKSPKAYM